MASLSATDGSALTATLQAVFDGLGAADTQAEWDSYSSLEQDAFMILGTDLRDEAGEVTPSFANSVAPDLAFLSASLAAAPQDEPSVPGANAGYRVPNTNTTTRYCVDLTVTVYSKNAINVTLYSFLQKIRWCWLGAIVDYGDTLAVTGQAHVPFYFYRGNEAFEDRYGNKYTGEAIGRFEFCPFLGCVFQRATDITQTGMAFGFYNYKWTS